MRIRRRTGVPSGERRRKAHRGGLLNGLGLGSVALGCFSLFPPLVRVTTAPALVWTTVYVSPFAVAAMLLGLATRHLARRHIRHMRSGEVDPAGERSAEAAGLLAGAGVGLALAGLLVAPVKWLLVRYLG